MSSPLHGVKVLDLTRLLPGPLCSLWLSDLGAEVVKVEEPGIGDYIRHIGQKRKSETLPWLLLNRNKKSICLNLKESRDKERFLKLVAKFDVVIESFRPGVMSSLGLGYEELKRANAKIIFCSLTGYGQSGPYKDRPGHDNNYLGYAGILNQMGNKNEKPALGNFQIADIAGGSMNALVGILAALFKREREGCGSSVDVAMLDGAMALAQIMFADHQLNNQNVTRGTSLLSGGAPGYQIYETSDQRYVALGAIEKKFWDEFCLGIGRSDLISANHLPDNNADKTIAEIQKIIKSKTQSEWIKTFEGRDTCLTPVLTLEEALKDPQILARNLILKSAHPTEGDVSYFALPIKFDGPINITVQNAPALGADTEKILKDYGID